VLVDGDLAVYDSTLIFEYLEDRYPEPRLYPTDVALRARCRQLEAAADEILFPPVWDLIAEVFYPAGAGKRDAERVTRARAELARSCDRLEKDLSGRQYLCDSFSVADIATFVILGAATSLGFALPQTHSGLRGWNERVGARPAVRREMDEMAAFVRGS
jgi:glutathione S-transferase